jgi:DNA-binding transcriptional regulator YiaG
LPSVRITLKTLRIRGFVGQPATLGDQLKARRLALGLRQRDVADLLGVCERTVINWETGRRRPPKRAYEVICSFVREKCHPNVTRPKEATSG